MHKLRKYVMALSLAVILTACSDAEGNFPGSEYMPDMAHSVAMESNLYDDYYYNTWDKESTVDLYQLMQPRGPVNGTVPRGYAGGGHASDDAEMATNTMALPVNGFVPYHFANTPEGRLAAIAELIDNPFPITEDGLVKGGELYNVFCGLCHGASGNGLGYLYNDEDNPNAKYPLAPANFLTDQFYTASNGRYYNAIYYGYNAMGAYKDKMSYEERWQVIHYIRGLQATELGVEYGEAANTLNAAFGTPVSQVADLHRNTTDGQLRNESMIAGEGIRNGEHRSDDEGSTNTTIINK